MNPASYAVKDNVQSQIVPDLDTAHSILGILAGRQAVPEVMSDSQYDPNQLATWLENIGLGSLGHVAFRKSFPDLAVKLQPEYYLTAAQNALHWRNLQQIDSQLDRIGIPSVLLKGAALAETVYERPELRSMCDVDLWFREQDMSRACSVMAEQAFTNTQKTDRPLTLQALADGEIQYMSDDQPPTLIELHFSPFPGWWLQRTAAIDKQRVWSRKEALDGWNSFYKLAAEDAVINIAIHLAVNHQFSMMPLRGLIDIALLAQARAIDWQVVAERASKWRVATAVWLVLDRLQQLIGTPGLEGALEQLQPTAWRRRQLRRFVTPESVLAGKDISGGRSRYIFLLLLVDRPRDAAKIIARTLWPESEWLDARYGGSVSHWQHIQRIIVERDV